MDGSKLKAMDVIALASVAAFFIATFLPWFEVSLSGDGSGLLGGVAIGSASFTGWDVGFIWSVFPLFLGFALLALLLVPTLAPDVDLPDLPPFLPLVLGGVAALLVLLKILLGFDAPGVDQAEALGVDIGVEVSRSFGIFLAFLASLGMTAAGFLKMQSSGTTSLGGAGGTAPPQPF